MATIKKSLANKKIVKAQKGTRVTPLQMYLKKYPNGDTTTSNTDRWGAGTSPQEVKALDNAFKKTYSNYNTDFRVFDNNGTPSESIENGIRRPGMKNGGKLLKTVAKKAIVKKIVSKSKKNSKKK